MSTPKSKKSNPWIQCDVCNVTLLSKDIEKHSQNCELNGDSKFFSYPFIRNKTLFSELDFKANDNVKGLCEDSIHNLVFLSQSAIQLCDLCIGEWAVLRADNARPLVKKVWPTIEKNLASVLLSKDVFELYDELKPTSKVLIHKIESFKNIASLKITVTLSGNTNKKFFRNFQNDLLNRLSFTYKDTIVCTGNKLRIFFFGKVLKFVINSIEELNIDLISQINNLNVSGNDQFYLISEKTQWIIVDGTTDKRNVKHNSAKLGGLTNEINELNGIINAVFKGGHKLSTSVLVYGHSGTGKTILVDSVTEQSETQVVKINSAEIFSQNATTPEETIQQLFNKAILSSPSILVIDEVDLFCPIKSSRSSDSEKRITSSLQLLLDDLHKNTEVNVLVISITNKIDNIDPSFRRHGRLGREMEIPTPNSRDRHDIFIKMTSEINHNLSESQIREISMRTHGFVGTDLAALCNRAALNSFMEKKSNIDFDDFQLALHKIKPSAMREVQIEVPNVKWEDVGGQEKLKLILKQSVEWPLKHAESFTRLGITPPKGILMFGPPGCSKTMIAKALATESGLNFLSIKGPELFSKWVGESERAVREVFRKARQVAPSVIFFDEIDALGGERTSGNSSASVQERVLAQLLTELDGITPLNDVTILAATNRPDKIDKALLRPGRLDRIVYVPLPDEKTRREIFNIKFKKIPVSDKVDLAELVAKTESYSGAEINAVCQEAAMKALEEDLNSEVVCERHFLEALKIITPRTSASLMALYEDYLSQ